MQTKTRFELEQQMLQQLLPDEEQEWREFSNTLKRSLLLAAGFMDVATIAKVVKEIIHRKTK